MRIVGGKSDIEEGEGFGEVSRNCNGLSINLTAGRSMRQEPSRKIPEYGTTEDKEPFEKKEGKNVLICYNCIKTIVH